MTMKSLVVQGRQGAMSAAGIKAYRQNGLLIAQNFFSAQETDALTQVVKAAAAARGRNIFPALDAELAGEIRFDGQLQPKPSVQWDKVNEGADVPAEVRAAESAAAAGKAVEYRHKTVDFKFKNQRQIDRAYRRLAKRRQRYEAHRASPRLLSEEEEMAGKVNRRKLREAEKAYTESQMKTDFDAYKASGQLELDLRRENHINDTFAFIGSWSKSWSYLLSTDEALRRHVLRDGGVGPRLGEAAAALSGEVVIRVFSDSAYEAYPFMNATPVFFGGAGADFASSTALSTLVGLSAPTGEGAGHAPLQQPLVMVPGSHRVALRLTSGGADVSRFQMSSVFDFGKMLRLTPELHGLEPVALAPLAPGSVLFLHNFTLVGTMPTLQGSAATPFQPPPLREAREPYQFTLSLMPDRCAFRGERNSWASRDSHGPLRRYEQGQLLVDDATFPVLHRALDIE